MSVFRICRKFKKILSKQQLIRILELTVLMFIAGILEMCSVSLIVPFIEAIMNPGYIMGTLYCHIITGIFGSISETQVLFIIAVSLGMLFIIKNIYMVFMYYIQACFVYGNRLRLQQRLYESILARPYEYFLSIDTSDVIRVINSDIPCAFLMLFTVLGAFTDVIIALMLLVTIVYLAPMVTLCMAVLLTLILLIVVFFIKPRLKTAGIETLNAYSGMNKWILQSIEGIKDIKVMSRESFFKVNFNTFGHMYVRHVKRKEVLSVAPRYAIEGVILGGFFIVASILIAGGFDLQEMAPVLSGVAFAAIKILPSVNKIYAALGEIAFNEPALDKLIEYIYSVDGEEIFERTKEEKSVYNKIIDKRKEKSEGKISVENISYHYPGRKDNVLSDVCLEIKMGETIGIKGESGAGKTTLVDIIMGLLKPQSGQVHIIGKNTHGVDNTWKEEVGYIPQNIFLLDDTIRNNVVFGKQYEEKDEEKDEEKVWSALKEASLYKFVTELPNGIDTKVGERGVRLSGGQRQRIGIARALYSNPSILIFDEATSALDNETERQIMESVNHLKGKKTMIMIAHRLSTLEVCDHIYVVENGGIRVEI